MRLVILPLIAFCLCTAETPVTPPVTSIVVTGAPTPLVGMAMQAVAPPAPQAWINAAPREYTRQYEYYVPKEFKSNDFGVVRAWNAAARPNNGQHLTPEGEACASDADCAAPLACFSRADSGRIPVRMCALPPGQ